MSQASPAALQMEEWKGATSGRMGGERRETLAEDKMFIVERRIIHGQE